jgi:hypothetical protein
MGSSRLSIVSLVIFFIGGILLLTQVNETEGIRYRRRRESRTLRLPRIDKPSFHVQWRDSGGLDSR